MSKANTKPSLTDSWGWFRQLGTANQFDFVIELLFLAIMFLVPTIFDRRLGIVFSGTKVAWMRALVVLTLGLWSAKLLITKQHRFIRTPLDWPILGFLLATTVATLTSVHPFTSFVGFYGRFEGLTTWYVFGCLFFLATNYIRSADQIRRLFLVAVSVGTLMSIYAVIQRQELDPYVWGGVITWQRVIGTIGQPNFLAGYILMALFLGMIVLLEERQPVERIDWSAQMLTVGYFIAAQTLFVIMIYTLEAFDVTVWYLGFALVTAGILLFVFSYQRLHALVADSLIGLCLVLIYVSLLYTQSRGGYMGLFTGAVLFALIVGRYWLFRHWRKIVILCLAFVAISGVTMMRPDYSPFKRFSEEISSHDKTAQLELKGAAGSRGETWKSAFKIIADNPLFGVGPEVLKMVFPRYETELFRFRETFHVKQDRCHNETLDVPVTKGIFAFAFYLWIVFSLFYFGWQKSLLASDQNRLVIAGLLAAALAYLIQNQFSFGVVAITSLFWVIWALVMNVSETEPVAEKGKKNFQLAEPPWLWLALVTVVIGLLIYFSFFSFRSDVYFKAGKTNLEVRRFPAAIEELQRSLAVYPFEGMAISHLGITNLNMGNLNEAIKAFDYGTKVDPFNADNFYMLARVNFVLAEKGDPAALARAENYATTALKIDPYYAEAYDLLGQIKERQGDLSLATKLYEKAFIANPTLADVMQRAEASALKSGQKERFRRLVKQAAERLPNNIELYRELEKLR